VFKAQYHSWYDQDEEEAEGEAEIESAHPFCVSCHIISGQHNINSSQCQLKKPMNEPEPMPEEQVTKYFKIKKSLYKFHETQIEVVQMVDVSRDYVRNEDEKKLLSLINATVSHELRTPLNSIINKTEY